MSTNKNKQVQLSLAPKVRAAAKMRAEQRSTTLSGHVTDLIVADAKTAQVWAILNREEACDD